MKIVNYNGEIENVTEYTAEQVSHPTHYNSGGLETIDKMRIIYGDENTVMFCEMNAFKYVDRAGLKVHDGETREQAAERDINKAREYKRIAQKILQEK